MSSLSSVSAPRQQERVPGGLLGQWGWAHLLPCRAPALLSYHRQSLTFSRLTLLTSAAHCEANCLLLTAWGDTQDFWVSPIAIAPTGSVPSPRQGGAGPQPGLQCCVGSGDGGLWGATGMQLELEFQNMICYFIIIKSRAWRGWGGESRVGRCLFGWALRKGGSRGTRGPFFPQALGLQCPHHIHGHFSWWECVYWTACAEGANMGPRLPGPILVWQLLLPSLLLWAVAGDLARLKGSARGVTSPSLAAAAWHPNPWSRAEPWWGAPPSPGPRVKPQLRVGRDRLDEAELPAGGMSGRLVWLCS